MVVPQFQKPIRSPIALDELDRINEYLSTLSSQQILEWAIDHLPHLYQTTAFGLTGLATLDMLSRMTSNPPPLVFIDTLHHFKETLELIDEVSRRYDRVVHVYRPDGCERVEDFNAIYGERLWEVNEATYDYVVKVEPARRAYAELNIQSVITGRRISQGGARSSLKPLEVDSTGLIKLNPLWNWTWAAVDSYIKENGVPRNQLLYRGYKSVGDWHSTQKSGDGDAGERAGRWAGRADKTECGLHEDYFKMRRQMKKKQREAELRQKDEARGDDDMSAADIIQRESPQQIVEVQ